MAFLRSVSHCSSALSSKHILCGGSRAVFPKNAVDDLLLTPAAGQVVTRNYSPQVVPKDPLDTSFNNAKDSFKSKTTWELVRGYLVYTMCSSQYLVDNNLKVS